MPRTGSRPVNPEFASYSGRVMLDSYRGQMRVRKWPEKRGTPKSALVREMNEWFAAVNQLVKFAPAEQQIAAIDATKGSGLYPRDLLMHTISEGIMDITETDGTFVQHRRPRIDGVAFQGFRIQLNSTQGLPAGTPTTISWGNPVLDTAAFWNVGNPTVITIPAGVTVMVFGTGWLTDNESGQFLDAIIQSQVPQNIARNIHTTNFRHSGTLSSGPIPVAAGETYKVILSSTSASNLLTSPASCFWGELVGTT